jgi:hypothetical protein
LAEDAKARARENAEWVNHNNPPKLACGTAIHGIRVVEVEVER